YGAFLPDSPAYVPVVTFECESPHAASVRTAVAASSAVESFRGRLDMRRGSLSAGHGHAPAPLGLALEDPAQASQRAHVLAPEPGARTQALEQPVREGRGDR